MAGVALIIGNGFDIDMGIPSKYSDFIRSKEWQGVVKRVVKQVPGTCFINILNGKKVVVK